MDDWQEDWLELWLVIVRLRQWIILAAAIALGPILEIAMSKGLLNGAFALLVLIWAIIVPLLTSVGGRLSFLVWQVAVLSITLAVLCLDFKIIPFAKVRFFQPHMHSGPVEHSFPRRYQSSYFSVGSPF